MNDRILLRARLVSVLAAVVLGLGFMPYLGWRFGVGVAAAGLWGVAGLRALEGLLKAAVQPPSAPRSRRRIFLWIAAKLGVYVVGVWVLTIRLFSAPSILVGLTLPLVAIAVMAVCQPSPPARESTRGDDE